MFQGIRKTFAEIDLSVMYDNYNKLVSLNGNKPIILVIKADAYGHGAIEVFKYFFSKGLKRFAVALIEEALQISEISSDIDMLIFMPLGTSDISYVIEHSNFIPIVSDIGFILELERVARSVGKKLRFGIEVDTGMGRLGIHHRESARLLEVLGGLKNLELTDIMTHFPSSDFDREFSLYQIGVFDKVVNEVKRLFPGVITHVSNSGGVINIPEASKYDFGRCGLSVYGYYPNLNLKGRVELKNSFALKSYVALKKFFKKGESISYNRTYFMKEDGFVGIIPCGYADGIPTLHSNKMEVFIKGWMCPVVGRVTMDYTMVLIPNDVGVGDEVLIFGGDNSGGIRIEDFAFSVGMIPYEVTCGVSKRVPRIYKS